MKIFKQEYFKDNFKIKLKRFLREVSIMARMKHIGTVDLTLWSVSKFYTEEGKYDPDREKFQALILTPYYEHLNSQIFKKRLQKVIFIYGCLRTYAYIHSFDYVLRNINEENILCSKGTGNDENLYFPKISNFNTSKKQSFNNSIFELNVNCPLLNIEKDFTKKRDVLSFGIFFYTKTENIKPDSIRHYNPECEPNNPFKSLIEKIITEENNRIDFHDACLILEKEIAPSILTQKKDMDRFKDYVNEINTYEGGYYGYSKIDTLFDKMNLTDNDEANQYQKVRKILKQANQGDPRAAFVASLYYYTGNILPKDLTLCFLYLKISCRGSFNTIVDSFRRSLISIMYRKRKINQDEEEEYDDEALFYQGAFYESPKVVDFEENSFFDDNFNPLQNSFNSGKSNIKLFDPDKCEDINKSIKCYMDSLNIKKSPEAYGRIGTLLTKYSQKKSGPSFLKLASDLNDLYGMVNYGLYLVSTGNLDKAEEIFLKLHDQEYIDASFTLGNIYFSKGEFKKSYKYFTEATNMYGDDNAEQYTKCIQKKINEQKK